MARQRVDTSTMTADELQNYQRTLASNRARRQRNALALQARAAKQHLANLAAAAPVAAPVTPVADPPTGPAAPDRFGVLLTALLDSVPKAAPTPDGSAAAVTAASQVAGTAMGLADSLTVTAVADRLIDGLAEAADREAGLAASVALAAAQKALADKLARMDPDQLMVWTHEEHFDELAKTQKQFVGQYVNTMPMWQQWRAGKVNSNNSSNEDAFLKALYAAQGYDALPVLVSQKEMDILVRHRAGKELFRGVKDYNSTAAKDFVAAFQSGDYWAGRGVNGPGTYTGSSGDASGYAGNSGKVRMMLSRKARVVPTSQVVKEMNDLRTERVAFLKAKKAERMQNETEDNRKRFIRRLYNDRVQAINDITSTEGYFAVWIGYDALSHCSYSTDTRVVYNRGMLYVQRELVN